MSGMGNEISVKRMTRRMFVSAVGSAAAGCVVSKFPPLGASRWYKGMLHSHTLWSDGYVLPEQAVKVYKDAGYDFLSITDHNRIGKENDRWLKVSSYNGKWRWPPKTVDTGVFAAFRRDFPELKWRVRNGETEVRLSPVSEVYARFNEAERFLCLPGCEVTVKVIMDDGICRDVHMNYIGLDSLVPCVRGKGLVSSVDGTTVKRMIRETKTQVDALVGDKGGRTNIFFVNHPHYRFCDVLPEDVADNSDVRFFEVCNNGSSFAPVAPLPSDGFYMDRFWDAVNAVRCLRGEPLLYAVATDDTHSYPGCGMSNAAFTFGDGWIGVKAERLSQDALFAAMHRGDFYAASGVDFEDIEFDGRKGTLSVSVSAKAGVSYSVRFITTKRGADVEFRTVEIPAEGRRPRRNVPVFSDSVGRTVKSEFFAPGVPVRSSYTLAPDDLYVRARVESDEPAVYSRRNRMHPTVKTAWTQPFRFSTSF